MSTIRSRRRVVASALVLTVAFLLPSALAAQTWDEVTETAEPIPFDGEYGVGFGEVADGFASFSFELRTPGPISAEVNVTEVRMGLEYEDEDSILSIFDADGYLIAENDDGPSGWESLLNGIELAEPGLYYLVVTTHPAFVTTDDEGSFAGFSGAGLSNFSFEIVVERGARELAETGDGPLEVAYTLDDVFSIARPLVYEQGEALGFGEVGDDIAVFEVYAGETAPVAAEVLITDEYTGRDSVLTVTDANGVFIAEDDDGGNDGASRIDYLPFEAGEVYYVIVSSWPQFPALGPRGRLVGFEGRGQSSFAFELYISQSEDAEAASESSYVEPGDAGERTDSFAAIVDTAFPVERDRDIWFGGGIVFAGYESFRFDATGPTDVTVEVVNAAPDEEAAYGFDSMLALFDDEGRLIATDDDSGEFNAAKIENVRLPEAGSYYAVVTSYPNEVAIDGDGYFDEVDAKGGSFVDFTLVITEE